ncbi:MAG: YitT family protein [Vibrio sp.]|uniref:YitT family protein n=1 Tax=Vibrio sp. TaxID=678 RepID=UPI003A89F834
METHSRKEDWIAIFTGTFIVSQGLFFLKAANLITGGTAGLALLLTHIFPWSFGTLYFFVNMPFYLLAWKRFGVKFSLNTAISCGLVSVFTDHLSNFIAIEHIDAAYCALAGGLLTGLGMLILFRHRSSLGGFNVLCLFIQDKFAISVGKTQLVLDCIIVFASLFYLTPSVIMLSIAGAVILNIVLAMNHKPSRYSVKYI